MAQENQIPYNRVLDLWLHRSCPHSSVECFLVILCHRSTVSKYILYLKNICSVLCYHANFFFLCCFSTPLLTFAVHHRVFTIFMYALSLYCYQLDDILSFGQYLKLSLAESTVLMALTWSLFSTYFFSWFPFLTYPDELLLEVLPCYFHIVFTFTTNFLWSCVLLYIHHRTQIAIDARRCGVWEKLSPGNTSAEQQPHKCPNWRQGHKYTQHAVVTSSSKLYTLRSPSSSYPFPPVDGLLAYRQMYFPVLATETGPLYKSRVLSYLLMAVLTCIAAVLGAMFVLPAQVMSYRAAASHCTPLHFTHSPALHCTCCRAPLLCFASYRVVQLHVATHTYCQTRTLSLTPSVSLSLSLSRCCFSLCSTTWAVFCRQPPTASWYTSPARTTT